MVNRLKNALRFFGAPIIWIAVLVGVVLFLAHGYPLAWLHPTDASVEVTALQQTPHPEGVSGEVIGSGWVAEPENGVDGQFYLLTACTETSGFAVWVEGDIHAEVEEVEGLPQKAGNTPVISVSLPRGHLFSRIGASEYYILEVDEGDIDLHPASPPAGKVTGLHSLGEAALVVSTETHDAVGYMSDFPAAEHMKSVAAKDWDAAEEIEIDSDMHTEQLFVQYSASVEQQSSGSEFMWPEAAVLSVDEVRFPQVDDTRWGALSFHLEDLPEKAPNSLYSLRLQVIQDDKLQQRLQAEHLPEGKQKPQLVFPSVHSPDEKSRALSGLTLLYTERQALLLDEHLQPLWRFEPPGAVSDREEIASVLLHTDGSAVVGAGDKLFYVDPDGNLSGQIIFTSPVRQIMPLEETGSLMVVIMNHKVALCSITAETLWSDEIETEVVDWAVLAAGAEESPRWRLDVLTLGTKHSYVIEKSSPK